MTQRINYGDRYLAHARLRDAKRRIDEAKAELEKAETDWREAYHAVNRIEDAAIQQQRKDHGA